MIVGSCLSYYKIVGSWRIAFENWYRKEEINIGRIQRLGVKSRDYSDSPDTLWKIFGLDTDYL